MSAIRCEKNPIITPDMIKPSREGYVVECSFNAGVAEYDGEIILLLRVAERPVMGETNIVGIPMMLKKGEKLSLEVMNFDKNNPAYDFSDSRLVRDGNKIYLTSISHLRLARSKDGIKFEVDDSPFIFPETIYEAYGVEDPRITFIDGEYYINYSAVSSMGITTALVKTKDFKSFERLGIIFAAENRDVCIFPEKIGGKYYALHRPVPRMLGEPEMWIASSKDLIHWGKHCYLMGVEKDGWDEGRIGGGAVPFKTEEGWVAIYHGADRNNRYCLGAVLLEHDNPCNIIARTKRPILEPQEIYEKEGFFNNVVFTCGAQYKNGVAKVYYGVADKSMALAEIRIQDIYRAMAD